METNNNEKPIRFTSCEGEEISASIRAAMECKVFEGMTGVECNIRKIPVPNVDTRCLKKVLEYCEKHSEETEKVAKAEAEGNSSAMEASKEHLKKWDEEFVEEDVDFLYDLIVSSNYLAVDGLLHLLAQKVADVIKGKSPEWIRHKFKIPNDFTPEEEAKIRKEHAWAFQNLSDD